MKFSALIISLLIAVCSFATDADEHYLKLFEQANEVYKVGKYDSAKSIYSEIAENGIVSAELFYNLGNCNFKTGQLANAILNYERALRLSPGDEDIRYNLDIANSQITDKIEAIDTFFLSKSWQSLAVGFHPDSWAWLVLIVLATFLAFMSFFLLGRQMIHRKMGLFGAVISFIFVLIFFGLGNSSLTWKNRIEAIVFAPSVTVKSEPNLKSTDQFVLHEGVKVTIIQNDNDWMRIRLSDGNSGWIPLQAAEKI